MGCRDVPVVKYTGHQCLTVNNSRKEAVKRSGDEEEQGGLRSRRCCAPQSAEATRQPALQSDVRYRAAAGRCSSRIAEETPPDLEESPGRTQSAILTHTSVVPSGLIETDSYQRLFQWARFQIVLSVPNHAMLEPASNMRIR